VDVENIKAKKKLRGEDFFKGERGPFTTQYKPLSGVDSQIESTLKWYRAGYYNSCENSESPSTKYQ
jgi:hypothetical protein